MTHEVDGFELAFTSRRSWKARRSRLGQVIDVVPVTWTKGLKHKQKLLEVWFQDQKELEARRVDPSPFVVAVARAKDYNHLPHEFLEFVALFRVAPTGNRSSDNSIETSVLERVTARQNA